MGSAGTEDWEPDSQRVVFKNGSDTYHYIDDSGDPICNHYQARSDWEDSPLVPTQEAAVAESMNACEQCQILLEHDGATRSELVASVKERLDTGTNSVTFSKTELEEIITRLSGQHKMLGARDRSTIAGERDTAPSADSLDE